MLPLRLFSRSSAADGEVTKSRRMGNEKTCISDSRRKNDGYYVVVEFQSK